MGWQDELRDYLARGGDPAEYRGPASDAEEQRPDEAPTQPGATPQPAALAAGTSPRTDSRARGRQRAGRDKRLSPAQSAAIIRAMPQHPATERASRAISALADAPTPGGLFPLIAALLFFIFAIVPVGPQGSTRLELMWRALTGGASIPVERGGKRAAIADAENGAAATVAGIIADAANSASQVAGVATAAEAGINLGLGYNPFTSWWNS